MNEFRTSVPFATLDLGPMRELPAEARSPELFFADELVGAVVDDWCLRTVRELGSVAGPVDEVARRLRIAEDRRPAFDWVLSRLSTSGLLDLVDGRAGEPRSARFSERALADAVERARPGTGSTFALITAAGRSYPAFLRGEVDGAEVLLNRGTLPVWRDYFDNRNLSYAPVNRIAAAAADCATAGRGLRVLEVGGGMASAAEALLDRVGERVSEYCFTELAPAFLAEGRARFAGRFPGVPATFARLDLDRPLDRQGVPCAYYDLVFAVNVLHAVRDLSVSLRALRSCLKDDGVLVLGEAVRPRPGFPVPIEFVFQLMRGFRESGGFLFHGDWPGVLERSGFADAHLVPDLEAAVAVYPTYSLAAIVASAGAIP